MKPAGVDDRELLRRLGTRGDEEAFRALYALHAPRLYLLALRILGGERGADDTLQETWIRAVRQAGAFQERSAVGTWLAGILINCCREELRRRSYLEGDLPDRPVAAPEPTVDLERVIRALPHGFRQVLVLHDVEGYTHEEIAVLLGIEPGTSKSQLARARERVRAGLSGAILREVAHD